MTHSMVSGPGRSRRRADDQTRQYNLLLLLTGGRLERPPSSGVDATMPAYADANADFIWSLVRLLLEPVILPFTLFLIIAVIAIIIAVLNILLGG